MGCKSSTEKSGSDGSKKGKNEPPDDITTLKSALMDWSDFLDKNCPDHKDPLLKAYLNGCVEVLKIHFHRKADKSVAFVKQVAEELGEPYASAVKVVDEDYCADDGMLRSLIVWLQFDRGEIVGSENGSPTIGDNTRGSISLEASFSDPVMMSMAQALEELSLPPTAHFSSYRELLQLFYETTQHEELYTVFEELSEGDQVLSVDGFASYLRTQGYDKDHQSLAREKIRTCFGGFLTKYNFSSYYSMPRTNSVYDPQRATVVWQDMTQPLTSYFIRTERVNTLRKVKRAVRNGVRCLLFQVKIDEEGSHGLVLTQPEIPQGAGVPFERTETSETSVSHRSTPLPEGQQQQQQHQKSSADNSSLEDILHWLKLHTFTGPTHSYPMILGFPDLEPDLENMVASVCTEVLGDDLAKGLMFEGATIQDPQFTPAALSNKFLLLAQQAALVPFVGFHVADMNRDGLGVKVTDVKEGTPAAKATITKDDWLTHVNGTPIANRKQLKSILSTAVLGQEIDLRKESQETATIVVGGSFAGHPSEMDKAAFLRLVTPEAEPGSPLSPAAKNGELAPWECRALPPDGSQERENDNHFGIVPFASDREDVIVENEKNGVQMIETSTSAARQWADGKFAENAKCGYVLKRKHTHEEHTLKFSIVTRFQKDRNQEVESFEASVFGGDQFQGVDGSITVNTVDELSLLVLKIVTTRKVDVQQQQNGGGKNGGSKANSPGKRSNPATPVRKESPSLAGPLAENDAVVREVYTASVPVHMLRKGYHAIPLRTTDGKTDSVVCLFERDVRESDE